MMYGLACTGLNACTAALAGADGLGFAARFGAGSMTRQLTSISLCEELL